MSLIETKPCMVCGKKSQVEVPDVVLRKLEAGQHIQHAWPEATANDRELLITGTHGDCWDVLVPDDE